MRNLFFVLLSLVFLASIPAYAVYLPGQSPQDAASWMNAVGAFNTFAIEAKPSEFDMHALTRGQKDTIRTLHAQLIQDEERPEVLFLRVSDPSGAFIAKAVEFNFQSYSPKEKHSLEGASFVSELGGPTKKVVIIENGNHFDFGYVKAYQYMSFEITEKDFLLESTQQKATKSTAELIRSVTNKSRRADVYSDHVDLIDSTTGQLIRKIKIAEGLETKTWFEGASFIVEYETGSLSLFSRSTGQFLFSKVSQHSIKANILGQSCEAQFAPN
jgi:hypothetical protein